MSFFESLLVLVLAAVLLLQLSHRMGLPYPAMLAIAGVAVGFVPGAPAIHIDPDTLLALFIAPVLLDAAYDFPTSAASKLWRPLMVLAVGAVLVTTALVAWIGWAVAGLPIAAAIVLGAIVAPPDAAAATAVLGQVSLPRRTIAVLKGESLFNDATALLLFTAALSVQVRGGLDTPHAIALGVAAPGGVLLGVVLGLIMRRISRWVAGTLGGNLLQFLNAFLVWIIAEHLELSAVLAVVACAMTVAHSAGVSESPRMRVHSFAVWSTVVFLLNVLAFLLMGMQARLIFERLSAGDLIEALEVAGLVIAGVIAARFLVVMSWTVLARRFASLRGGLSAPTTAQGLLVSWSGMRGMLSLATAFALPANFPQRDIVVLTAFAVVLMTLIVQGLSLTPFIRLLKLDATEDPAEEVGDARQALGKAALARLDQVPSEAARMLRDFYLLRRAAEIDEEAASNLRTYRRLALDIIRDQRIVLERLRHEQELSTDNYYLLQEEMDWRELMLLPEHERRIEEA